MSSAPNPIQEPASERHRDGAGIDAADLGLWSWDMGTGEAWYSAAFRSRLGYGAQEFDGHIEALRRAIHPEDLPRFDFATDSLAHDGTPVDLEVRIRRRSGSWAPCRIRAEADGEGARGGTHATGTGAGTGAAAARGPGRVHGVLLDAGTRAHLRRDAERARPARAQRIAAALDESARTAEEFAAARRELERQNLELQRARADAVASAIAKTAFLANMSHEIRTPMTAVLGFADMLGDPSIGPEEQQALIVGIRRNGEHLLKIISDILDLSKIEAGGMSVEPMPCRPVAIVEEAAALLAPRARQHGVTVEVHVAPGTPPEIRTDPTRLRQILLNLVSNAVKFTQRGTVRIEVERVPRDEPATPRRDPEPTDAPVAADRIRFRVTDTGIGMNEAQIARLFKPFTQADATMARRFGGTGLGLAISRRLARMLGGDIVATSAPAQGSCFSAEIAVDATEIGHAASAVTPWPESALGAGAGAPSAASASGAATAATATPASASTTSAAPPLRVLLAEDGIDNQRLLRYHLARLGADPQVVENGRDAIAAVEGALARGEHFDAVLLDMQMPLMDGYEVARRLRTMGVRTPIAALTADAMAGDRERCLAAGCDEYLSKPLEVGALRAFLDRAAAERVRGA